MATAYARVPAVSADTNTVVMLDELRAMSRAWDCLADAATDFSPEGIAAYETAKLDFYAMRSRIAAGKAVLV